MLIQTTISDQDLETTGLSPQELSVAIQQAVQNLKHPVSSATVTLPSTVEVKLYKETSVRKVYY